MKSLLNFLLLLVMVTAAWQIGFRTPPPIVSAQDPSTEDPFGGDSTEDPFGRDTEAEATTDQANPSEGFGEDFGSDPFGRSTTPTEDRADADGSDSQGDQSTGDDPRLAPYRQNFELELIEVADDGLSFQKIKIKGTATVAPQSLRDLPEVKISSLMGGSDQEEMYGGGMSGEYGGEMMMDMDDGSSRPWQRLSDEQRREVGPRVMWQAQADWVRRVIRADASLEESDAEQLKTLVREVLKAQYTDQLRRQHIELQVVMQRLRNLRDQLGRRARATDRVVDFELQRLELEAGGMGLGPDVGLEPAPEPRRRRGAGRSSSGYGYGDDYMPGDSD